MHTNGILKNQELSNNYQKVKHYAVSNLNKAKQRRESQAPLEEKQEGNQKSLKFRRREVTQSQYKQVTWQPQGITGSKN